MSTVTAQILVGQPHTYHGGIGPTHYLFLLENSKPVWVLANENISRYTRVRRIRWIPTIRNMLEDALLMIGVHVIKDKELIDMAMSFNLDYKKPMIELYSTFSDEQLNKLYKKCKEIENFPKIVVVALNESTIKGQLDILEKYKMDVNVCVPIYSRSFSEWTKETEIKGSLNLKGNSYAKTKNDT